MTRDEIAHAKTARSIAISVLRAFVADLDHEKIWAGVHIQDALDLLRSLEREIADCNPTPDDEGENSHEKR